MMITKESARTARHMVSLAMARRENTRCLVVHDDFRVMEAEYLLGADRLFELLQMRVPALKPSYSHSSRELRLRNGSRCFFKTVGHERDLVQFKGLELDVIVIDQNMLITAGWMKDIEISCHRTTFTPDEMQELML